MQWTGAHGVCAEQQHRFTNTLQVLLPVLFGFLPEEPIPVEKRGLQMTKIRYIYDDCLLITSVGSAEYRTSQPRLAGRRIYPNLFWFTVT
jgi:hypothetical protein